MGSPTVLDLHSNRKKDRLCIRRRDRKNYTAKYGVRTLCCYRIFSRISQAQSRIRGHNGARAYKGPATSTKTFQSKKMWVYIFCLPPPPRKHGWHLLYHVNHCTTNHPSKRAEQKSFANTPVSAFSPVSCAFLLVNQPHTVTDVVVLVDSDCAYRYTCPTPQCCWALMVPHPLGKKTPCRFLRHRPSSR